MFPVRFQVLRIVAPFGFLASCGGAAREAHPRDGMASVVVPTGPRVAAASAPTGHHAYPDDGHLAAGDVHMCALLEGGVVKCWGQGEAGQLGLGATDSHGAGPQEMGAALPAVDLGTAQKAIAVTAGGYHTCALLEGGAVKCWGSGAAGQLGLGDTKNRGDFPRQMGDRLPAVDLGTARKATAVSAGWEHTCALLEGGVVKCWGSGAAGQLGLGDTKNRGDAPNQMGDALPAVDLGTGRTAIAVSAGRNHTCAVLDDGAVKCWGYFAQLGLGARKSRGALPKEMGDALPAVDLGVGNRARAVRAGAFHSCALLDRP